MGHWPFLAIFARVGSGAAGATFVRSAQAPLGMRFVVPALRKVREERGTHCVVMATIKGWATRPPPVTAQPY